MTQEMNFSQHYRNLVAQLEALNSAFPKMKYMEIPAYTDALTEAMASSRIEGVLLNKTSSNETGDSRKERALVSAMFSSGSQSQGRTVYSNIYDIGRQGGLRLPDVDTTSRLFLAVVIYLSMLEFKNIAPDLKLNPLKHIWISAVSNQEAMKSEAAYVDSLANDHLKQHIYSYLADEQQWNSIEEEYNIEGLRDGDRLEKVVNFLKQRLSEQPSIKRKLNFFGFELRSECLPELRPHRMYKNFFEGKNKDLRESIPKPQIKR